MSSSSSESSEDEEEVKKISEAVIPNDLLSTLTSSLPKPKDKNDKTETEHKSIRNDQSNHGNERTILQDLAAKFKKKERRVDTAVQKLKSNRPDKMREDDQSAYHATTPGFRAHIEKRLQQILDSDIEGYLRDSVWKKSKVYEEKKMKGIKLFSGVKSLCVGQADAEQRQEMNAARSPPKIIPRKRRLNKSSSSESSDEEMKISSCVFTVDDIMHENRMLDNLSKSGVEVDLSRKESKEGDNIRDSDKNTTKKGQKKTSKADVKHEIGDNIGVMKDRVGDGLEISASKEKKKKRKESQQSLEDKQEVDSTAIQAQSYLPGNKKKKKKTKKNEKVKMINVS